MPIDIQTGEIAARLRRFLLLRGRVSARLDEMLVPTVEIASLRRAPYSRDPLSGWHLGAQGAVAAEIAMVGLIPQGADKLVIKQLYIGNPGAGAIQAEVYQGQVISASPTLRAVSATNIPRPGSGIFPLCTTNGWDDADPALPGTPRRIGAYRIAAGATFGPIRFEDWVLATDDVCWVSPAAVNQGIEAVWNFDEYNTPTD